MSSWRDELIMGGPVLPDGHALLNGLDTVRDACKAQSQGGGVLWFALLDVLQALEDDRDHWRAEAKRTEKQWDETQQFHHDSLRDLRAEKVRLELSNGELERRLMDGAA